MVITDLTAGGRMGLPAEKLAGVSLKIESRQGALDRFRQLNGKVTPDALKTVFALPADAEVGQEPPVALSDGESAISLSVPLSTCPAPRLFALDGVDSVVSAEPSGELGWLLVIIPRRGTCSATLAILCNDTITIHPLTVAPLPGQYHGSPASQAGGYCPEEYVTAANRLAGEGRRGN